MKLCFPTKESYQHIRAVALEPGGASVHTHRAIHWGSTGRQGEDVSKHLSCRKGNAPSCIQSGTQFFAVNLFRWVLCSLLCRLQFVRVSGLATNLYVIFIRRPRVRAAVYHNAGRAAVPIA